MNAWLLENLRALKTPLSPDSIHFLLRIGLPVVLAVLAIGLVIAFRSRKLAARFPGAAAFSWPYAPLIALAAWAVSACLDYLIVGNTFGNLGILFGRYPWARSVVALILIGVPLARMMPRKGFRIFFGVAAFAVFLTSLMTVLPPGTLSTAATALRTAPGDASAQVLLVRASGELLPVQASSDGTASPWHWEMLALVVSLILLYEWLSQMNLLRSELPAVEIGLIENAAGARVPKLERIIEECLTRSAPHAPPRFPGGAPVYWRQIAEAVTNDKHPWQLRTAGYLMLHVLRKPTRLRLHCTVSQKNGQCRAGLTLQDADNHKTLLAQTYVGTDDEDAAAKAGYAAAERTLLLRPWLPEYALWREEDGSALQSYWRGMDLLDEVDWRDVATVTERGGGAQYELFQRADKAFRDAAIQSNGNAMARLQLGQVLEARGRYFDALEIYLELAEHYPRLVIASYRLAVVLGLVEIWSNENVAPERWEALEKRLAGPAFLHHTAKSPKLADLRSRNDIRLATYFLELADRAYARIIEVARWRALWWSLHDNGDRRRFWETLLWPPGKRRASYYLAVTARACAQLRRCQLRAEDTSALKKRIDAIAAEARCAMRTKARAGWGNVHYNLAVFHALHSVNIPFHDLPAFAHATPDVFTPDGQLRVNPRNGESRLLTPDPNDVRAAVNHLSYALSDPAGPLASGNIWWIFVDPKLSVLRRQRAFEQWKGDTFGAGVPHESSRAIGAQPTTGDHQP